MAVDYYPWEDPTPQSLRDRTVEFWKRYAPEHVAEGIADRVHAESGFKPTAVNPESGATGLYQDLGERKSKLRALANWENPDVQHRFAYSEVTGGDPIATAHWDEIKNAKTREEAARLWDRYFERSRPPHGSAERIFGTDRYRFSDRGIAAEQGRSDRTVAYMSPSDYLSLVEPIGETPSEQRKDDLLRASVDRGDEIEAIPSLDVRSKARGHEVYDYDGRHRAQLAQEAGLTHIPVSLIGASGPTDIKGMTGTTVPQARVQLAAAGGGFSDVGPTLPTQLPKRFPWEAEGQAPAPAAPVPPPPIPATAAPPPPSPPVAPPPGKTEPVGFPYDEPGTYYGSILPFARDPSGAISPAIPEMIRQPVRGAIEMGQRALGIGEAGQDPLRPLGQESLLTLLGTAGSPISGLAAPRNALSTAAALTEPPRANALAQLARDVFGNARVGTPEAKHAFNRGVSHTIGEDSPWLTSDVMGTARTRIGGEIQRIEESNTVKLNDGHLDRLAEIEQNTWAGVAPSEYAPIKNILNNIIKKVEGDPTSPLTYTIPGTTYGRLLRHNAPLDMATRNRDANIAAAARNIQEVLRDSLQDSLSGDDLAAYRQARTQYKNLKIIDPIVSKSPDGDVSPKQLNDRVSKEYRDRAERPFGDIPISDLAYAGVKYMQPPSGATHGGTIRNVLGRIAGFMAGSHLGHPFIGEYAGGRLADLTFGRAQRIAPPALRGMPPSVMPFMAPLAGSLQAQRGNQNALQQSFPGGVFP